MKKKGRLMFNNQLDKTKSTKYENIDSFLNPEKMNSPSVPRDQKN